MKKVFQLHGYDQKHPAMYSMICWIVEANMFSGTAGMTFEDFLQYSTFFFS